MKIDFFGYYGMSNYGDDLFAVVNAHAAGKYWPGNRFSVLSPFVNGLPAGTRIKNARAKLYGSDGFTGSLSRLVPALSTAITTDKFVFGGGSLFTSQESGVRSALSIVAKHRKKVFSAVGVSIGPFDSGASERKIQDLLKTFEYVAVRDKKSFDIANSFDLDCPVILSRDLAGLASSFFKIVDGSKSSARKIIGYSPCNILGRPHESESINCLVVEALALLSKDVRIVVRVVSLNNNKNYGDERLCGSAQEQLKEKCVDVECFNYSNSGPIAAWGKISDCDSYISTRLHGAISAYLSSVPFCLLEYHGKCADFLDDIGHDKNFRVDFDELNAGDFCDVIKKMLFDYVAPLLTPESYQLQAATNFTCAPWAVQSY